MASQLGAFGEEKSEGPGAIVVYNGLVVNQNRGTIQNAEYIDNRAVPILFEPWRYRVAVTRFSVSGRQIPVFIFNNGRNGTPDDLESVTMTDTATGSDYTSLLLRPGFNQIFSISTYVAMVNDALTRSFTALAAAHPANPAVVGGCAPFYTWDGASRLFSLWVPKAYNAVPGVGIQIWMTYEVASRFGTTGSGGGSNYPSVLPKQFQRQAFSNGLNGTVPITDTPFPQPAPLPPGGVPAWRMTQDYPSIPTWNSIVALSFEIGGVPVVSEFQSSNPQGTNSIAFVLTDFLPDQSQLSDQSPIQYYPQGPLRWYPLTSLQPIQNIDLRVYWTDRNGTRYPVVLGYQDAVSIKLEFRRVEIPPT